MVVDDLDLTCTSTTLLDNAAQCIELTRMYRERHSDARRRHSRHGGSTDQMAVYERWQTVSDHAAKHYLAELEHRLSLPTQGAPSYRLAKIEDKMGIVGKPDNSGVYGQLHAIVHPAKQPFDAWVLDHVAQLNANNEQHCQQALVLLNAVEQYHNVCNAGVGISNRIELLREII